MLNAFLPRIGSFSRRHVIRNVSDESNVLSPADIRDCEIGVPAKVRLHLDEISPARNERVDIIGGFGGQFSPVPERENLIYPEYLNADTNDEIVKAVRRNIAFGAKVKDLCRLQTLRLYRR